MRRIHSFNKRVTVHVCFFNALWLCYLQLSKFTNVIGVIYIIHTWHPYDKNCITTFLHIQKVVLISCKVLYRTILQSVQGTRFSTFQLLSNIVSIEAEWRIYASLSTPSLIQMMACRLVGAKGRRQAIIWTSAGILLIGRLGTTFNKISIAIYTFSFKLLFALLSNRIHKNLWKNYECECADINL